MYFLPVTMMELDFSKVCRVCLGEGVMMSLFKVNISKKVMACASVQVWQSDGLPTQICSKCCAKLHISFQFKKLCEKSDATLRQYLTTIGSRKNKTSEVNRNNQVVTQSNHSQLDNVVIPSQQLPQIVTQTVCDYIGNNGNVPELSISPVKYDNFMQVTQEQNVNQISYSLSAQDNIQIANYNQDVGQIVYNGQYAVPVHNIQIQSSETLQPTLPPQVEDTKPTDKQLKGNAKQEKSDGAKQCPTCNKVYGNMSKLTRHMKIHSVEKPYKCKTCGKEFSHSGNFKIHLRMHTDERPFKCPVCGKGCRQAQDLEKHMRIHTGERPYKCTLCVKAFTTSSNLIAHIRTHTGERPYVCCVCQKAFCQSNELTKHMRTHTGEKSHVCDICNKGFNGSSTLIVHRRSHTGERPYVCKFCNKGFIQSSCLASHMKKHKLDLKCTQCDARFTTVTDLRYHMVSQHKTLESDEYDMLIQRTNVKELICNMCNKHFLKANDYKRHLRDHANADES